AAVIDLAITISSPMYELSETNPNSTKKELFQSGMRVGREILATSANTIYFAYFGGQVTLFFWFFILNYSFAHIINSKIFAQEFISILLGEIAVAISIPITAWLTALLIKHQTPFRIDDSRKFIARYHLKQRSIFDLYIVSTRSDEHTSQI